VPSGQSHSKRRLPKVWQFAAFGWRRLHDWPGVLHEKVQQVWWKQILVVAFFWATCLKSVNAQDFDPLESKQRSSFSIDRMQRRTFDYFWELADPKTGLIPDRFPSQRFCSIAATGFGLTSYVIGVDKKFITRQQAAQRVEKTLGFLLRLPQGSEPDASGHQGFFYHFLDMDSGGRYDRCELSSIDTALLMAGVISCGSYFDQDSAIEKKIRGQAKDLFNRVQWEWMVSSNGLICMGWKPESGFLAYHWQGYDEAILLHVLAAGSDTHPIDPTTYQNYVKTYRWAQHYGQSYINFGPLFGHQYSQMYIDFRGIADSYTRVRGIDYFENSRRATLAQWEYAKQNPKGFIGYGKNVWGLTACDGPGWGSVSYQGKQQEVQSYSARGISIEYDVDDGTIAPTAAGGSLPFAPEICMPTLKHYWEGYQGRLVGKFGYFDSFNLTFPNRQSIPNNQKGPELASSAPDIWINGDYLGIDQGPILIQSANHQSQIVWKIMMKNQVVSTGLQRLGFRKQ